MPANVINMPFPRNESFHFEYTLKVEKCELEGISYIGVGVLAKMVDTFGNEKTEYLRDVTTELDTAHRLMSLLDEHKVSPMCLRMFVEDFLSRS